MNQLGFRPDDQKTAILLSESWIPDIDCSVINVATGAVEFQTSALNLPSTFGFQSTFVVYHDDADYSTNEPTLEGSESLLFILAWFAGR